MTVEFDRVENKRLTVTATEPFLPSPPFGGLVPEADAARDLLARSSVSGVAGGLPTNVT